MRTQLAVALLALAACDEYAVGKAQATKIAADAASQAVAQYEKTHPTTDWVANAKGRFQVIHPSQAYVTMVLLDTVTGQSWRPCRAADVPGEFTAWCELERGAFAPTTPR